MAEIEDGKIIDREIILNRRINYTIIKKLWKLRNDGKSMETFYMEKEYGGGIGISRNKYSRIINNAEQPRLGEDSVRLQKQTGVSKDIYMGRTFFSVHEFERDKWETYFKNKNDYSVGIINDKERKNIESSNKDFENKLLGKLKSISKDTETDENLFRAYYYFSLGDKFKGTMDDRDITLLIGRLDDIDFLRLDNVELKNLKHYEKALKKQLELVVAINKYKSLKL